MSKFKRWLYLMRCFWNGENMIVVSWPDDVRACPAWLWHLRRLRKHRRLTAKQTMKLEAKLTDEMNMRYQLEKIKNAKKTD